MAVWLAIFKPVAALGMPERGQRALGHLACRLAEDLACRAEQYSELDWLSSTKTEGWSIQLNTVHREMEDAGWRGKVGWIQQPKGSMDPFEFMALAPPGLRVIPTLTYNEGYSPGGTISANAMTMNSDVTFALAEQVEQLCVVLKDAGADIITQSGGRYSFAAGGLAAGLALQARVETKVGIPLVMMGLAILNAVKDRGYKSAVVNGTVYGEEWAEGFKLFLQDGGIEVVGIENWVQEGIFKSQDEVLQNLHPLHSRLTLGMAYKGAITVARKHPGADCLILLGGAIPVLPIVQPLEEDLGMPVITSTVAQFWEVFQRLGIRAPIHGYGSLLASLASKGFPSRESLST